MKNTKLLFAVIPLVLVAYGLLVYAGLESGAFVEIIPYLKAHKLVRIAVCATMMLTPPTAPIGVALIFGVMS